MNRGTLLKTVSKNEEPTPGYLYEEVISMTRRSPDVAARVAQFYLGYLTVSSPIVRRKALKVIQHTCARGNPVFRLQIQRNAGTVKSCLQFSGPSDQLHGDRQYKAVRDSASECLEAIFDETQRSSLGNPELTGRITGYGNPQSSRASSRLNVSEQQSTDRIYQPSYSGSSYNEKYRNDARSAYSTSSRSPVGGGRKYEGIGNPNFADPRQKEKSFLDKIVDRIDEYGDKFSKTETGKSVKTWLASSGRSSHGFRHVPASSPGSMYTAPPNERLQTSFEQGRYVNPLPSKKTSSSMFSELRSPESFQDSRDLSSTDKTILSDDSPNSSGFSDRHERILVNMLCSSTGVLSIPPRDKLAKFLDACKTLNPKVVMSNLFEKLSSSSWKVQNKALCVCEAFLSGDDIYEAYVDYMDENSHVLEELLMSSAHPTVQSKCNKVWSLLYGESFNEASEISHDRNNTNHADEKDNTEENLLGLEPSLDENGEGDQEGLELGLLETMDDSSKTQNLNDESKKSNDLTSWEKNTGQVTDKAVTTDLMGQYEDDHESFAHQLAQLSFDAPDKKLEKVGTVSHKATPPVPLKDNVGNVFDSLVESSFRRPFEAALPLRNALEITQAPTRDNPSIGTKSTPGFYHLKTQNTNEDMMFPQKHSFGQTNGRQDAPSLDGFKNGKSNSDSIDLPISAQVSRKSSQSTGFDFLSA